MRRRIEITGHGFLTDDIAKRLSERSAINPEVSTAVIATLNLANKLVLLLPIYSPSESVVDRQLTMALTLLVRLIEIAESTVILSAFEVRQDVKTLLRVFLDAYFIFANVCNDPEFVAEYVRADEIARRKLINAAFNHDGRMFAKLKDYATPELRAALDQRIKDDGIQEFQSARYARQAGCVDIYDAHYRILSASVHTTPRCFLDYLVTNDSDEITAIRHDPDAENADQVLYDIAWFLLTAIENVSKHFSRSDFVEQIYVLRTNLSKMDGVKAEE